MGDAIFFREATGIDEALRQFAFVRGETEAEIDAAVGARFDLREDVVAVEGHHGLAGAGFYIGAERFAKRKKFVVDGAERGFSPGVLMLDILRGSKQIFLWGVFFPAL